MALDVQLEAARCRGRAAYMATPLTPKVSCVLAALHKQHWVHSLCAANHSSGKVPLHSKNLHSALRCAVAATIKMYAARVEENTA